MQAFQNKRTGIIFATELKKVKYKVIYWLMFSFLMAAVLISVLPTIWIMLSGFKEVKEIYSVPPTFLPKKIELSKVVAVWKSIHLGKYYLNSFVLVIGEVVFAVVVNAMGGYVISRIKPKGSQLVFAVVVWVMLMPSAGRLVPIYMEIVDFPLLHLNMTDTYFPMWLMSGANCFSLLLFKNFFDSISISLVEAARIDGATDLKVFSKIMIPLSIPIVAYISISTAINGWGAFFWPNIVLDNQDLIPIATKLYKMKTEKVAMDEYFLTLVFSVIPVLIIFALFQKQIMGGINIGGVKG